MLSAAFGVGLIIGVIFDVTPLLAESKAEKVLRERLAVSETARLASEKEKDALLTALSRAQAALTASAKAAQTGQVKASDAAAVNAAGAQATAELNASEARQTGREAKAEREKASETASQENAGARWSVDRNTMTLFFGFLTMLVGNWFLSNKATRERNWQLQDAQTKHDEQLGAVRAEGAKSAQAIEHSNHLTEKIVEMRSDMVAALKTKENRIDDRGQEADDALARINSAGKK
jgi:hypothetical protein